jgi:hypothetical protein
MVRDLVHTVIRHVRDPGARVRSRPRPRCCRGRPRCAGRCGVQLARGSRVPISRPSTS